MGVRGCGLGYNHRIPEVLPKKLAPMNITPCAYLFAIALSGCN